MESATLEDRHVLIRHLPGNLVAEIDTIIGSFDEKVPLQQNFQCRDEVAGRVGKGNLLQEIQAEIPANHRTEVQQVARGGRQSA